MDPLAFSADYLSDSENDMKNLITWFLNQAMLQKALQQAGADSYERTDARKAHRNGYKDRSLKTRYGETVLQKPQFSTMLDIHSQNWSRRSGKIPVRPV